MCGIGTTVFSCSELDAEIKQDLIAQVSKALQRRGEQSDEGNIGTYASKKLSSKWDVTLLSSVLHLRGESMVNQPLLRTMSQRFPQEAKTSLAFCWNGECYGYASSSNYDYCHMEEMDEHTILGQNDTEFVMSQLEQALEHESGIIHESNGGAIAKALSRINGEYAFILHHDVMIEEKTHTSIYFGRDPLGRRSLLLSTAEFMNQTENNDDSVGDSCLLENSFANEALKRFPKRVHGNNLIISSVAPNIDSNRIWHEVPPGVVFCLSLGDGVITWDVMTKVLHSTFCQPGSSPGIPIAIPTSWSSCNQSMINPSMLDAASSFYNALNSAVRRRVSYIPSFSACDNASVAVLFSGGLDSVVLAALAHKHVPLHEPIDLINVAFCEHGQQLILDTPDRAAALLSFKQLSQNHPMRRWNFVAVDVEYSEVLRVESHIYSLIHPKDTHMDFNIGAAMWFASRGKGRLISPRVEPQALNESAQSTISLDSTRERLVSSIRVIPPKINVSSTIAMACSRSNCEKIRNPHCIFQACTFCCTCYQKPINRFLGGSARVCLAHNHSNTMVTNGRTKRNSYSSHKKKVVNNLNKIVEDHDYKCAHNLEKDYDMKDTVSDAKVLLVGIGADEQLAGYGRHRATFSRGGAQALRQELDLEMDRLWSRNLGRDDRCLSDHGKEARFPFLDEQVISYLRSLPLDCICDLENQPAGIGDKMVLRLVAAAVNMTECSGLVKRAIQFGSRIAKLSSVASSSGKASGTSTYVCSRQYSGH